MIYLGVGTAFAGDVIMADDMTAAEVSCTAEPGAQTDQRPAGRIGELSGAVRMADFDGDGIGVSVVAGRGDFPERDALNNLSFQPDDEM